jgi:predicted nicotinamide N-methyase
MSEDEEAPQHVLADGHYAARDVELGTSFLPHGNATLGPLSIACDGDIAGQLWGAGAALSSYVLTGEGRAWFAERPEVVEVGAGTGLLGMAAACAGASAVTVTDLPENVARMAVNIEANAEALEEAGARVVARALPWGDTDAAYDAAPEGCDVVLGADLCYNPKLFDALLETLAELAAVRGARTFVAVEQRWDFVNQAWEAALARSRMELLAQFELPRPDRLPRPVLCFELGVRDEGG